MKPFLNEHFLLDSSVAQELYHNYASDLPIIDYHNHLPPDQIAENRNFQNITQIWLYGDHYKWRAMRANGVHEDYITGDADDKSKFAKWAETVPYTMRNPLYHWTHLELQRYFNISDLLTEGTAESIYQQTADMLQDEAYSTQSLLQNMSVETVCTTDDPLDSLEYHVAMAQSKSTLKVLPTFRPDRFLKIGDSSYVQWIKQLQQLTNTSIEGLEDLLFALNQRVEHFHAVGCRLSDHGLSYLPSLEPSEQRADQILKRTLRGDVLSLLDQEVFQITVVYYLARMYHEKEWVMQFHLGALRDNNDRLQRKVGSDIGCDSIGDFSQAKGMSMLLNRLDSEDKLPKSIFYNLNPADNEVFATMMGNYNDGSLAGKMQWGSAWWYLDQKDGMEKQIDTLSNMGLLSRFVGMLTDSRSFLSFPRHEYFRRILCNLVGHDVVNGQLPYDVNWLGKLVTDICYKNAKSYFDF